MPLGWIAGADACPRGPKEDAAAFIALLKTAAGTPAPASTSTQTPVPAKRGKEQPTVETTGANRVGSLLLLKHTVDLLKHDLACRTRVLRGAPLARLRRARAMGFLRVGFCVGQLHGVLRSMAVDVAQRKTTWTYFVSRACGGC